VSLAAVCNLFIFRWYY